MDAREIQVQPRHRGHYGPAALGSGVEWQAPVTILSAPDGETMEIEDSGFETKVLYRAKSGTVDLTRHQQRYFPTHEATVDFWRERFAEFKTRLTKLQMT